MLVVELHMIPFGYGAGKRSLGTIEISNVGGDGAKGNYVVAYYAPGEIKATTAQIRSYPRGKGAWELVKRAISKVGPKGRCP